MGKYLENKSRVSRSRRKAKSVRLYWGQ